MKDYVAGNLCISVSSGSEGTKFRVTIEDDASGVQFLEAVLDPTDFGLALSSRTQPCRFRLRSTDLIGKRRESKHERVWVPGDALKYVMDDAGNQDYSAGKPLIAPFEVDGWQGYEGDLFNHHNRVNGGPRRAEAGAYYTVRFVRHVDAK